MHSRFPTLHSRRRALSLLGLGSASLCVAPAIAAPRQTKLVLVQLKGGNDGLNTVVPFANDAYRRLRPQLAHRRDEVIPLGAKAPGIAFASALEPLMAAFSGGDLAVVQGLGYPNPNRSHFRSSDIWHTASDAEEIRSEGWLSPLAPASPQLFAVNVATQHAGPLEGVRAMVTLPSNGLPKLRGVTENSGDGRSDALQHVLDTERRLFDATEDVTRAISSAEASIDKRLFPKSPFGQSLHKVAAMILGGSGRLFRVQLGGFDTHKNQKAAHARLHAELATGLMALRTTLQAAGQYDDVCVCTYSEFGRRAAQNRSGGTDHGTAAPHFVLGGKVMGGVFGAHPSLTDLDKGDLKHTTDFRRLYQSLAVDWLGLNQAKARANWGRRSPLALFRR